MKKGILLVLFIAQCLCAKLYAQRTITVQGSTLNSAGSPLPGSSVTLFSAFDSLTTATDAKGNFLFPSIKADSFHITITSMGFETFSKKYTINKTQKTVRLEPIILKEGFNDLEEVVITAVIPVKIKEDTVEFDARAYKVREGDAVDEMVKKLPGVEVDKDGNVTTEGEPVTKVRLNGKDFFGDDAAAALQNLPADIVKNIQIIDDYGELSNLTGIKNGEPSKIININTQPDKETGYFIKGGIGLGSQDRYNGRLRANDFKQNQQLSFDGKLNNTSSSGGIQTNRLAKADYRADWGPDLVSYGSYKFENNSNNKVEKIFRQDIYKDYTRYDDENTTGKSKDNSHRFSWNLEYQINKDNYLKIEPDISYKTSRSRTAGLTNTRLLSTTSVRDNKSVENTKSSALGTELFYNHKFGKPGRNLSVEANISYSGDKGYKDIMNDYSVTDSLENTTTEQQHQFWNSRNKTTKTRTEVSYMEPINLHSFVELEYQWDHSDNRSIRDVQDIKSLSDSATGSLNNNYNYQFTTNQIGLNYHYRQDKYNYRVGLTAQPALLKGEDISRGINTAKNSFNLMPSARFSYKVNKERSFFAYYRGKSNQPGFTQLQPITDNSDLQNTVKGNPDLKPELENRLQLKYKQSSRGSGFTIFSKLSLSQTQNKIVTSSIIIPDSLKKQTTYLNADGFRAASGSYSISKPFYDRKYTLTYYGGSDYSRNIAFNNNERNIGNNITVSQGIKLGVDIEDVIDARLNAAYSLNSTTYSLESFSDRNTRRLFIGLEGRNYLFNSWVLGYDFSKTINRGYTADDLDPAVLNLYFEYQFLKGDKGRIRLQGYDLFNQNSGITRDVFDNQIVDRQTTRLGRYFMLSFEFRLDKFG